MTVKLIVGYLRLMQRVMHHYELTWAKLSVQGELVRAFQQSLQDDQRHEFDADQYTQIVNAMQTHFDRPVSLVMAEHLALQDVGLMGYLA